jgi:6-phosphogluconolactonase
MKFDTIGRVTKALIVSLALGLGATACSRDFTLAYLYVTTAKSNPGLINAYDVDYQSGALLPIADSPIPSGGDNPVAIVAAPNGKYLYVIHRNDSNVVEFAIGTDGKLYAQHTYNVQGSFPTAAAIDPTGYYLYVTSLYQPGYTTANPGPGNITIFPISQTDNSLGNPVANGSLSYFPIGNNPVSIAQTPVLTSAASSPRYLYVVDQETTATPTILGFTVPVSSQNSVYAPTGPITPTASTSITTVSGRTVATGTNVGVTPSAIAISPVGSFAYVTDQAQNLVFGFVLGAGGTLTPMVASPFNTGLYPVNVTIDPRGEYLYTANYSASTLSAFAINTSTGTLSASSGSASVAVGTGPTCIAIEDARGIYLYTSNAIDNSVTGEQLNPHNGGLTAIQNTPFTASGLPTCVVAVANGSHPTQSLDN